MSDGFLESLLRDVMIIEMSRDSSGMINPFAAAGMAYGLGGDLSGSDLARLGTLIGIKGGFDGIGGNLLSTTKNTIRYTVPVEELLNSKSYQAYSVDLIGLDKERREATKTLWDMYLVKHPDYHEDVMMMYDDANKITHGIGPLPAIILVASFVYYKYWHIDTPKWFACRHEIKKLCQDKSVVWDVVFQIQDEMCVLRKHLEEQQDTNQWMDNEYRRQTLSARYKEFFGSGAKKLPAQLSVMDKALYLFILIKSFIPAQNREDAIIRLYSLEQYLLMNGVSLAELICAYRSKVH